jgi:hypothetical protein
VLSRKWLWMPQGHRTRGPYTGFLSQKPRVKSVWRGFYPLHPCTNE